MKIENNNWLLQGREEQENKAGRETLGEQLLM